MKVLLQTIGITLILLLLAVGVSAQVDTSGSCNEACLRQKITDLQSQGSSLQKQISLVDSQVKLTTLRVTDAQSKIAILEKEIGDLNNQIDKLEEQKTKRLELVLHRIPQSYKRAATAQFGWVLFSQNFAELLAKTKYLLHVQQEDSLLYKQLQLSQINYNERRDAREKKKVQQEELRLQLQKHTQELAVQKKEKQILLSETQSSEVVYQRLLAQALAEKNALERSLVDSVKIGPVKQGDPIALVGNTGYPGCSTGAHLHYEVRKGGNWVDPSSYLSRKTVSDQQSGGDRSLGDGSWAWPISDTIQLNQFFGKTPWSYRYSYSGGIHTGFDMTSTSSNVIRAPADGELFSSSQNCGTSSVIKIKYIDHGSGLLSFFLHVQ
ncbi:peptidoglycan DD-metalloendopeptidase family protein [Candidatus Woesebacteria bacterium]|nr:peptidoglycan DD-metalloendopeptidase family protein [Candidatus Woesebacteria bacterium]